MGDFLYEFKFPKPKMQPKLVRIAPQMNCFSVLRTLCFCATLERFGLISRFLGSQEGPENPTKVDLWDLKDRHNDRRSH